MKVSETHRKAPEKQSSNNYHNTMQAVHEVITAPTHCNQNIASTRDKLKPVAVPRNVQQQS